MDGLIEIYSFTPIPKTEDADPLIRSDLWDGVWVVDIASIS